MSTRNAHIDRLFATLPRTTLCPPNGRSPAVKRWAWNEMRPYNGFGHDVRVLNWQMTWYLMETAVLPFPTRCAICGVGRSTSARLSYHAECYFSLDRMAPLCDACHKKLHQRTYRRDAWARLVADNTRSGEEWFCHLPADRELDVNGWQKARFPGVDLMDYGASPLFTLPTGVTLPAVRSCNRVHPKPPVAAIPPVAQPAQLDLTLYPGPIKPSASRGQVAGVTDEGIVYRYRQRPIG